MRPGILLPLSAGPRIKRSKQTSPPFLPPAVKALLPQVAPQESCGSALEVLGAGEVWRQPRQRPSRAGGGRAARCRAERCGAVPSRAGRAAPAAATDRGPASNAAGVCRDVREGGGCGFNYL